jgi:hypothetical protein
MTLCGLPLCVLVFNSLLSLSCSSSPQSGSDSESRHVPGDFQITVGQGGGISGIWQGYAIRGGDSVYAWTGREPESNSTFLGLIPADSLLALWNVLGSTHLLDSASVRTYSNYSRMLSIRVSGVERMFQCPIDDVGAGSCGEASRIGTRAVSMLGSFFAH